MTKQQMELSLDQSLKFRRAVRRQRRLTRARWWFAQMRQIVSQAAKPTPVNSTEVEQTCLALQSKTIEAVPRRRFGLN